MGVPSFEQFAKSMREFAVLSSGTAITPATRFEKDLGITGDDGKDLLVVIEKHFGVQLSSREHGVRQVFSLKPNESLFHSEGFDLLGIFSGESVREFTVGELYDVVCRVSKGSD
jgi:hypothetical protein